MHVKHARNFYKDVKDPLTLEELQDAMAGKDGKAAYVLLVDGLLAGYAFTKLVEIRSNPIIAYSAEKCHLFRNRKPLSHSANPITETMSWWLYSVNSALLLSS